MRHMGRMPKRTVHGQSGSAIESGVCKLLESQHAPVAQLDRALVSGTKGRRFESSQAYFVFSSLAFPFTPPFNKSGKTVTT